MVLNLKNTQGKWKPKWIATGLTVKGNKRKAEAMLRDTIRDYESKELLKESIGEADIFFSDYINGWLETMRPSLEETTITAYRQIIRNSIMPYFQKLGVRLHELKASHIQSYYDYLQRERHLKATSIKRHHANIRKALQHAVRTDLIPSNPADKVVLPKQMPYHGRFYNNQQLAKLFEAAKGHMLELPVIIAACYGLRRSELLGLRWDAIDLHKGTISIKRTVTPAKDDEGNRYLVHKERTKNKSSYRTLPLIPMAKKMLLEKKAQDEEYKKVCGRAYSKEFEGYVFVDQIGRLLAPGYLTQSFPYLLKKHGLPRIRFHDLRHSCASYLLSCGVPLKSIQEWLGHSSYATTANIYTHLTFEDKQQSADCVSNLFSGGVAEKKNETVQPAMES